MLRRLRDFHAWTVETQDDRVVGQVEDFLIDTERWVVRYLVVTTGPAFADGHLLISTLAIEGLDWDGTRIVTELTREQIRSGSSGPRGVVPLIPRGQRHQRVSPPAKDDPASVRSVRGIRGCHVHSLDGKIGRIDDVFADDEAWTIPYFAIIGDGYLDPGTMLMSPDWIRHTDWISGIVSVESAADSMKTTLACDPWMAPGRVGRGAVGVS